MEVIIKIWFGKSYKFATNNIKYQLGSIHILLAEHFVNLFSQNTFSDNGTNSVRETQGMGTQKVVGGH